MKIPPLFEGQMVCLHFPSFSFRSGHFYGDPELTQAFGLRFSGQNRSEMYGIHLESSRITRDGMEEVWWTWTRARWEWHQSRAGHMATTSFGPPNEHGDRDIREGIPPRGR